MTDDNPLDRETTDEGSENPGRFGQIVAWGFLVVLLVWPVVLILISKDL